jgi:hypothetical protein
MDGIPGGILLGDPHQVALCYLPKTAVCYDGRNGYDHHGGNRKEK